MQSLLGYNLLAFTHYTANTNINVKDVNNLTYNLEKKVVWELALTINNA
jgi:hypothetical protein